MDSLKNKAQDNDENHTAAESAETKLVKHTKSKTAQSATAGGTISEGMTAANMTAEGKTAANMTAEGKTSTTKKRKRGLNNDRFPARKKTKVTTENVEGTISEDMTTEDMTAEGTTATIKNRKRDLQIAATKETNVTTENVVSLSNTVPLESGNHNGRDDDDVSDPPASFEEDEFESGYFTPSLLKRFRSDIDENTQSQTGAVQK